MKRSLYIKLLLLIISFVFFHSYTQNVEWANRIGSYAQDDFIDVVVDPSGNIYTLGSFRGNSSFDPNNPSNTFTASLNFDVFLAKYDSLGNYIWAKQIGGSDDEIPSKMAIIGNRIIIVGTFKGTADFDPSPITQNLTSKGAKDIFIAKYTLDGNYVSAYQIGGPSDDQVNSFDCKNNNLYLVGEFSDSCDFDPSTNEQKLGSTGINNGFIANYSTGGVLNWVEQIYTTNSNEYCKVNDIVVSDSIALIGGYYNGSIHFFKSSQDTVLVGVPHISYGFISTMNINNVSNTHAVKFASTDYAIITRLHQDENSNVYAIGSFKDSLYINLSSNTNIYINQNAIASGFLVKMNKNLAYQKSLTLESTYPLDFKIFEEELYLTGNLNDSTIFCPSSTQFIKTNANSSDAFLVSYDTSFNCNFSYSIGGTSTDEGKSLYFYDRNTLLLGGNNSYAYDSVEFDVLGGNSSKIRLYGSKTGFLAKYHICKEAIPPQIVGNVNYCEGKQISLSATGGKLNSSSYWNWYDNNYLDSVIDTGFSVTFYPYANDTIYIGGNDRCGNAVHDSIILNQLKNSYDTLHPLVCDNFTSPDGDTLLASGIYLDTLVNVSGCDSIIFINLTILKTYDSIVEYACDSFISPASKTYYLTGVYLDTLINANGCDSIIYIDLTILNSTSANIQQTVCNKYTAPNGEVFDSTGQYQVSILNSQNCDSIINIDLTILTKTYYTLYDTVCDIYQSPSGKIYDYSDTLYDTLINQNGCDSVLTIHLTVNKSSYDTIYYTTCNVYVSVTGNIYDISGIYHDTVNQANSCDSIITLYLTKINIDTSINVIGNTLFSNESGANYQWFNCDTEQELIGENNISFTPTNSEMYAVIIEKNGCIDSSSCQSINTTSIKLNGDSFFYLYPNPVINNTSTIYFNNIQPSQILLYSLDGKKIKEFDKKSNILEFGNIGSGKYLLKIIEKDRAFIETIIIRSN